MNTLTQTPVLTPVDIVIDLETLGTKPGCTILSIGACTVLHGQYIDPFASAPFYGTICRGSCQIAGLVEDPETYAWWMKQDPVIRMEAFSQQYDLPWILDKFSDWMKSFKAPINLWGNSPAFDCGILAAAYKAVGEDVPPWNYYEERDFRTVTKLFPQFPRVAPVRKHHALDDAIAEAATLAPILEFIQRCNIHHFNDSREAEGSA